MLYVSTRSRDFCVQILSLFTVDSKVSIGGSDLDGIAMLGPTMLLLCSTRKLYVSTGICDFCAPTLHPLTVDSGVSRERCDYCVPVPAMRPSAGDFEALYNRYSRINF